MHSRDVFSRLISFRVLVGMVALTGLLLSACGGGDGGGTGAGGADLSEVEAKLVELQEEKSPHLNVEGARCPDDIELEQGTEFECIVTIEGVEAPYAVTLTRDDPEAETGSFEFKPAKAIIDVAIVIDFIRSKVQGASGKIEVECGPEKVIVSDVGGTFECTVTTGADVQHIEMLVKDLEGTVSFNT